MQEKCEKFEKCDNYCTCFKIDGIDPVVHLIKFYFVVVKKSFGTPPKKLTGTTKKIYFLEQRNVIHWIIGLTTLFAICIVGC